MFHRPLKYSESTTVASQSLSRGSSCFSKPVLVKAVKLRSYDATSNLATVSAATAFTVVSDASNQIPTRSVSHPAPHANTH